MVYKGLDFNKFMELEKAKEWPKVSMSFSLDTMHLHKEFSLDLVIHHLSDTNMEMTKKVVSYVMDHFDKLFETAWTATYHRISFWDWSPVEGLPLQEFYQKKIDFASPYYTIQLELNSDHLVDGTARYSFVVDTADDISEDNLRCFMVDNKCWALDTNNDDTQMLIGFEHHESLYEAPGQREYFLKAYERMEQEGFVYAEPFGNV